MKFVTGRGCEPLASMKRRAASVPNEMGIWYVVNLHGREAGRVYSFGRESAAKRCAEAESKKTGCTYVVARGVLWYPSDCPRKCPHYGPVRKARSAHKR